MKKDDTEISLTDLVGFVNKTGTPKQNHVKQIKNRGEYERPKDFYAPLRERIQLIHKKDKDKNELDALIKELTDDKKISNYPEVIAGYKKYLGRKKVKWFKPPFKRWKVGEITIRINPELGLEYNGEFYVIKLHLSTEKLHKTHIDHILTLMEYQLRSKVDEPEIRFAVLDARRSKLYVKKDDSLESLPLLLGEAKSFEIIWNNLD